MTWFRINTGMNWTDLDGKQQRAEPGEVRDDLRPESVAWLLADGHLEVAKEPEPVVAPEPVVTTLTPWDPAAPVTTSWPVVTMSPSTASIPPMADVNQASVLQAELAEIAAERAALAAERAAVEAELKPSPPPDVKGL